MTEAERQAHVQALTAVLSEDDQRDHLLPITSALRYYIERERMRHTGHRNPSPSQTVAAWCNDPGCGAGPIPLEWFDPKPTSYYIDGRDHRIPEELRVVWDSETGGWK